jgi:hypothetical protein
MTAGKPVIEIIRSTKPLGRNRVLRKLVSSRSNLAQYKGLDQRGFIKIPSKLL